ncbi:MAG: DUF2764 family protein [Gammaproteobacteria bacterium]
MHYYAILGSLPHLPHFERAERLPITRLRVEQRISMLQNGEAEQLYRAEDLVGLRKSLAERRTDPTMQRRYRAAIEKIIEPTLREFVDFRIDQKTVLAALRLRLSGWEPSRGTRNWGTGRLVKPIEARWSDPDLRLTTLFPWIPTARKLLEDHDARNLDQLLLEVNWQKLNRIAERDPLGFEGVVAFLFKWDILNAWLARDAVRATQCFQAMVGEIKHAQ